MAPRTTSPSPKRPVRPPRGSRDRATGPPGGRGILSCRLRVALPEGSWLRIFTTAHPELRVEVQDRLDLGGGAILMQLQIVGTDDGPWTDEIRGIPGVRDVELIGAAEGVRLCRVVYRGPGFLALLKRLRLMRHFPFPVRNGVATWTVVGPDRRVRRFLAELERTSSEVHVDAIHHGLAAQGPYGLTARQQEILRRAMAEGYFDVPRRISLTELAPKIGVALSTLSVTLAVIEKKILEPHA